MTIQLKGYLQFNSSIINRLRKEMIFKNWSAWWRNYVYLSGGTAKFEMKTKTV